ncbi:hypothetical protein KGF57_001177 [Candida theae]|uniref:Sorting nexin-12 n=1 Tax=Candida theae TaxID=1198502 RepID=A0AAD5G056_9ASCO|nr:uncharacterized protein KGF57_001177 [Candida theae]KAI5963901.1 hypothetical protein KGF57_001177 [Candida theae]
MIPLALGFILAIVGYFYITIKWPSPHDSRTNKTHRFHFTCRSRWERETELFRKGHSKGDLRSEAISEPLSQLISLIINEFVNSWFSTISSSTLFADDIESEVSYVIQGLTRKLQKLDFAKLITLKFLPLFNNHYVAFIEAQKRRQNNDSGNSSEDDYMELLSTFNDGNLHVGVTVEQMETREANFREKSYLRGQMRKLISKVLSDGEKSNEVVAMLVTEILACTILDNIFNLITDADFINMQFVKFIGDSLMRRNQVKELRSALEEHTMSSIASKTSVPDRTMNEVEQDLKDIFVQDEFKEDTVVHRNKESIQSAQLEKLVGVLKSPGESATFTRYLSSKNKSHLLEFWTKVEQSKSPLSENSQTPEALNLTAQECIYMKEKYFDSGLIHIDDAVLGKFKQLNSSEFMADSRCPSDCKDALLHLQKEVFVELSTEFYSSFSKSVDANHESWRITAEDDKDVINQIDYKLAAIMSDQKSLASENISAEVGSPHSMSDLKDRAVFNRNDRYSRLFEDDEVSSDDDEDSDGLDTDTDSVILKEGSESMELAGPGNLNLTEKIPQIENEIDNLQRQLLYLEPLISKAQLTNNQSKLKVLLKSRNGVQRDIAFKELQKQQYIVQESDNSLFGKSKVTISSIVHHSEKTKEFVLYIIEVQKFSTEEPNVVKAGWVVARRYSQFHRLHGYLKRRYPQVSALSFPQKSIQVLKFQQKNITENRRRQLEVYLRSLIEIPEVCSDMAFRSFLSSENFQLGRYQRFDGPRKLSALFGYKWYLGSSGNRAMAYNQTLTSPDGSGEVLENRRVMEKELLQFDEKPTNKPLFIEPICDMIITLFNLHWLKGRALVVILQQFFGTAVENKVYEVVHTHLNKGSVDNWLRILRERLFPDGKFKLEPEVRTTSQKLQTYNDAKQLFDTFMTETWSRVFGTENTTTAASTLFSMLQINQLNKHLLFQILDEILQKLSDEERTWGA